MGGRAAQARLSPRLEQLPAARPGASSWRRLLCSVHLHLVNVGRGPAALDVNDVLEAGGNAAVAAAGHRLLDSASPAARLLQAGR